MKPSNYVPTFRRAIDSDVEDVAKLMRAAFSMWESVGFDPSGLSEAAVRTFLLKDGYVAEDANEGITAAICINFSRPRTSGNDMHVARAHRTDTTILLEPSKTEYFSTNTFAYIYSLAVAPEHARMGIGRESLRFAEKEALKHGCCGLLLETGKRTGWLVEWYEREGFKLIGNSVRASEPIVFMLKELPPNHPILRTAAP